MSSAILADLHHFAAGIRNSMIAWKVGMRRRYGWSVGVLPAESALARFSAITRMRAFWACRPVAAIFSEERKSVIGTLLKGPGRPPEGGPLRIAIERV